MDWDFSKPPTDSWTLKIAPWTGLTFSNSSVSKFVVLQNVRAYDEVRFFEFLCGFAIISCGGPVNWYLMKTKGNWSFELLIQTTTFLRLSSDFFVLGHRITSILPGVFFFCSGYTVTHGIRFAYLFIFFTCNAFTPCSTIITESIFQILQFG